MKIKGPVLRQVATNCKRCEFLAPAVHRLNIAITRRRATGRLLRADVTNLWRLGLTTAGREVRSAVNAVIMDHYTS